MRHPLFEVSRNCATKNAFFDEQVVGPYIRRNGMGLGHWSMLPPKAIIIALFGQLALGIKGLCWPEFLVEIFSMDWAMNMTPNSYLSSHWSLQMNNVSHGSGPLRQTFLWNLLCAFTFSVLSSVHIQPLLSMTTLTYDYKLKQQANKES